MRWARLATRPRHGKFAGSDPREKGRILIPPIDKPPGGGGFRAAKTSAACSGATPWKGRTLLSHPFRPLLRGRSSHSARTSTNRGRVKLHLAKNPRNPFAITARTDLKNYQRGQASRHHYPAPAARKQSDNSEQHRGADQHDEMLSPRRSADGAGLQIEAQVRPIINHHGTFEGK